MRSYIKYKTALLRTPYIQEIYYVNIAQITQTYLSMFPQIFYKYTQMTFYCDEAALMRLSKSAEGLTWVCLDSDGETEERVCTATGWGRSVPAGPLSARLRQVRVPLHHNSLCQDKYGPSLQIEDGHLCAGKLDGSTGACIVSICPNTSS